MQKFRAGLLLVFCWLCIVACDANPAPIIQPPNNPTTQPPNTPTIRPSDQATNQPITKLGIHLMLDDHEHHWPQALWRSHMQYARDLVGEWGYVVALIRLDQLDEVPQWQYFLDLCKELHLTPIVRFTTF